MVAPPWGTTHRPTGVTRRYEPEHFQAPPPYTISIPFELRRWRLINGRRRVGVMGGTFDPIHHGHLVAASEVAHHFGLDVVVFVPTGEPYQKDDRKVSPAE